MLNIKEIREATEANLISGSSALQVEGVSIDSRTILPNELFIALEGNRFDGHAFIEEAIKKGAKALLINKKIKLKNEITVLEVKDTKVALAKLAHYFRKKFDIPIIAIIGSCGKTTTKFLLDHILSRKYHVISSPASYNNQIGVPITLLKLRNHHQVAVIELGMNSFGEIEELTKITLPTIGVITNIGFEHLAGVGGTIEGVTEAEFELIKVMKQYNGLLILNADEKLILKKIKEYNNIIFYGINNKSNNRIDYRAKVCTKKLPFIEFILNTPTNKITIKSDKLLGKHNIYNMLAASATANILGVELDDIKEAISSFGGVSMRLQLERINKFFLLNDTYNANPTSVKEALQVLKRISHISGIKINNKIFIFGDMAELGKSAKQWHKRIASYVKAAGVNTIITIGELSYFTANKCKDFNITALHCENIDEIEKFLKLILNKNDIILIKGSRIMKLEKIIEKIKYLN